jgi:hypothetical protein
VDDADDLDNSRKLLWAALTCTVVAILSLFSSKMIGVFIVAWLASIAAGLSAISKVARELEINPLIKYAAMILVMAPVFNLLPLVYFLVRARGGAPSWSEPAPAQVAPSRPSGSAPARRAPNLSGAIAYLKAANLAGEAEGLVLQARIVVPGVEVPEDDAPIMRATKSLFGVCYVLDEGDKLTYINKGDVRAAGISAEELHRIGLRNLAALIDVKPGLRLIQGSYCGLAMGGNFEASLVLLDHLWDGPLKEQAPNGAIVAIPARDVCMFCDARSTEGIAELKRALARVLASMAKDGSQLISESLFLRKQGVWRELGGSKPAGAAAAPTKH